MAVYLIQAGTLPFVKIGKANNPVVRLKEHQTGHWETLKIIRLWKGGRAEEGALHRMFADLHIRGEWFSFSEAMLGDVGLLEISDVYVGLQPDPFAASRAAALLDNDQAVAKAVVESILKTTGLTPTELARKAGLTPSTLTRFLNKPVNHSLSARTLAKLKAVSA